MVGYPSDSLATVRAFFLVTCGRLRWLLVSFYTAQCTLTIQFIAVVCAPKCLFVLPMSVTLRFLRTKSKCYCT